ncbi:MAG: heat-inducible transcriptional repressor HrcA [Oscillospiraceae bacterium]|jgi:heat-inducible transcriptional repressor|nr:heat-inducible transcriptional repressor HrcA [Oscillospiraceae bacterium]
MDLSDRKRRILLTLVEQYIQTGEPVGSKALAERLPDHPSSATIRNEMAQLTELGYLDQPHTSAGRVPSPKGYRFYVDALSPEQALSFAQRARLEAELRGRAREPERLLESAGKLLAEITACAALCVSPGGADTRIRRVEMAPVGVRMAMVALLTSCGTVKSKILRTDSECTPVIRETFYRMAEEHLLGLPLEDCTLPAMQSLAARAGSEMLAMFSLLAAVAELAAEAAGAELLLDGQSNLYQHRELESDATQLLSLLRDADAVRQLLGHTAAGGLHVILGREPPMEAPAMQNASMILAPYRIGQEQSGLLGVVGPLRVDYARLIPSVRCLTEMVGQLMSQALEE